MLWFSFLATWLWCFDLFLLALQICWFCATSISWSFSTCWHLVCSPGRVPSANTLLGSEAGFSCSCSWHSASSVLKWEQEQKPSWLLQSQHGKLYICAFLCLSAILLELFWAALPLLPPSLVCILGWGAGLRKKEKQLWMWTTLWWLPPDAILDLNFTSDPHVNELSIHRVCVLQAVWIWNVPLFIWVSKLCVLDIDSPCCDLQCQHWAGRWNLWLPEAPGRVSNAINPAPEEISARLLCLMQLWFKQWWCLFRRWSISASWVAKVNYSHHTVLHSSTLAKNFLTSVKIQFMPIPHIHPC